jgi:hypothetical protein
VKIINWKKVSDLRHESGPCDLCCATNLIDGFSAFINVSRLYIKDLILAEKLGRTKHFL